MIGMPQATGGACGAVIVHGLTSDCLAVEPLRKLAHTLGLTTEAPLLRGHGTHYRDLRGVNWHDWMADVRAARARLKRRVQRIVLVGFSMGGLLALAAAAEEPDDVAAIVVLAPAVRIAHPLAPLAWLARGWLPYVPMGNIIPSVDPARGRTDRSYDRLATDAFCSFYKATQHAEQILPRITAPLLIIQSRRDRVIRPESALITFDRVTSTDKQLVWLERSNHALLRGCEAPLVLDHVRRFLETRCIPSAGYVPQRSS